MAVHLLLRCATFSSTSVHPCDTSRAQIAAHGLKGRQGRPSEKTEDV